MVVRIRTCPDTRPDNTGKTGKFPPIVDTHVACFAYTAIRGDYGRGGEGWGVESVSWLERASVDVMPL